MHRSGKSDLSIKKVLLLNSTLPGISIQNDPILPRCSGMVKKMGDRVYPLGLLLIASVLRDEELDVEFLDFASIFPQDPLSEIKASQPDFILVNSSQTTFSFDCAYMKKVRKGLPSVFIAVVGLFPTCKPALYLNSNFFDFIIHGEPEFTTRALIKQLQRSIDLDALGEIEGLSFLDANKCIVTTSSRPLIADLDALPFPAYDLIDFSQYSLPYGKSVRFALIATSRGCPYQCIFCSSSAFYGTKVRFRTPQNIVNEMLWLYKRYLITDFHFWDDTFTLSKKHVKEICARLIALQQENIFFSFTFAARVDHVLDFEMLQSIKKAGGYLVKFGIESGDPTILQGINKQISLIDAKQAIRLSQKANLRALAYFMLGFPNETKKTLKRTIQFALDLNPDLALFNFVIPWVGTALFDQLEDNLRTIPYSKFSGTTPVYVPNRLTKEELIYYRKYAYLRFFLRPRFIFESIKSLRNLKDVKKMGYTIVSFMYSLILP